MISLIPRYLALFMTCLLAICVISACEFGDPYVPDFAGSSTLTGRIVAEPATDVAGAEVFLRGQDSFTNIADADGRFHFQYITPGDYFLQVQKRPYLNTGFPVTIHKSMDVDTGDLKGNLKGAIAGTIPGDKLANIHGELELVVYADGVPLILDKGGEGDLAIDVSSTESKLIIHTITRITVFIDNVPYSAIIESGGEFLAEFIPPGIYSDVRVKLNTEGNSLPIASGSPIVVKSGQTRVLAPL
ncbi:carboxypeptidase-like regulatory domain-containing protein [Candidatus Poribacteria bacterium]